MNDLREYWNFKDPEASRNSFVSLLLEVQDPSLSFEVQCQIARTYSLERRFEEAHAFLDKVKPLLERVSDRARAAYHLERGRTFNSAGEKAQAEAEFQEAAKTNEDDYRVDAYHMLAICSSDPTDAEAWNLKALELTERSEDFRAKRWRASLLNNMAWTLHGTDRAEQALALFAEAVQLREQEGDTEKLRTARWCYARCLRTLGRNEEALHIQLELEEGAQDGYVSEELGEIYLWQGNEELAKFNFANAYELLSQDGWFVAEQPERLARLKQLGGLA